MINLRGQLLRKLSSSRKTVKLCLGIGRKSVSSRYIEISKQSKSFLPSVLSSLYRLPLISETKKEKKVKRRPKNLVLNRHDTRNRGNVVGCGQSLTNERTGNEGDPAISSDGRQRSDKFMAFPTDLFPGPRWLFRIADYSRSNFREETGRKEMETRVSLSGGQWWAKFNNRTCFVVIYPSRRNDNKLFVIRAS